MNNPEFISSNEETSSTKTAWDDLKNVPFMGSLEQKIDQKYDEIQRPLIDKQKDSIRSGDAQIDYMGYGERTPTTAEKAKRILLDSPILKKIMPKVCERALSARMDEVSSIASKEYGIELEEEAKAYREQMRVKTAERERRQEAERMQRERNQLARDMVEAREYFDANDISSHARNERMQEIGERAFNTEFTQLEDIEAESRLGEEVEKSTAEYEGQNVDVYTLHGKELCCLLHAIDFKGRGDARDGWRIGNETAKKLQDDPSFWMSSRDTVSGEQSIHGTSVSLSTTFFDSKKNFNLVDQNDVWDYGFNNLPAGSIISISAGDGGTAQIGGDRRRSHLSENLYNPDQVRKESSTIFHNEVLLNRYDEDGKPLVPDFVVTSSSDGSMISDTVLKHAAYFGVPILSIDRDAYKNKEIAEIENVVDGIDPNASYEDLISSFDRIANSYVNCWNISSDHLIGDPRRDAINEPVNLPTEKAEFARQIELEKKVEFIKKNLAEETQKALDMKANGQVYDKYDSIFSAVNHREHKKVLPNGSWYDLDYQGRLDIEMRIGGKKRDFWIVDGKNPTKERSYLPAASPDSRDYYSEIAPLVDAYIEAVGD